MASDALFQMLAQAKGQPDRWSRGVNAAGEAGKDILGGYIQGSQIRAGRQEASLKPFEIWSKIAEQAGPDAANNIFKQRGIPVPDMGQTSSAIETPDQLVNKGKYGANKLGAQEKALTLTNNAPFSPDVANFIGNGDVEGLSKYHSSRGEPVPYREIQQAIAAKRPNMMGGYFQGRLGTMQAGQLPSEAPVNEPAGAAAQVKVAARQGKALIAKATSPQNLALASNDLARAIQRATPTSETIGAASYAQSLPTLFGQLQQKWTADPNSPDVPKLRKQLYDTFNELDKAATPWIENRLQNMEANGTNSTYGNNWKGTRDRELGLNIPDIPFNEGSSQNPNISTGVPQFKYAKGQNGQTIRSKDNWASFEPVNQ